MNERYSSKSTKALLKQPQKLPSMVPQSSINIDIPEKAVQAAIEAAVDNTMTNQHNSCNFKIRFHINMIRTSKICMKKLQSSILSFQWHLDQLNWSSKAKIVIILLKCYAEELVIQTFCTHSYSILASFCTCFWNLILPIASGCGSNGYDCLGYIQELINLINRRGCAFL